MSDRYVLHHGECIERMAALSDHEKQLHAAIAAGDSPMRIRVSADLACRLGELARLEGTVLEVVLRANNVELEITDVPAHERLASMVDEVVLNLPNAGFVDAGKLAVLERYEETRTGCAKCRRPIGPNRRHCFACAMGKR